MGQREKRTLQVDSTLLCFLVCVLVLLVVAPARAAALASGDRVDQKSPTTRADWSATATLPFLDGGRLVVLDAGGQDEREPVVIDIDTTDVGQTWRGVGAALTDASVALLDGNEPAVAALFDPDAMDGAALDLVRLPLSSTDFSSRWWTWTLNPDGGLSDAPPEAAAAADVIASITSLRPDLEVIGAAWTVPPAMRTRPRRAGGTLLDVGGYRDLLLAQVDWLHARGVPLTAVSLGNEPDRVADTPTFKMTVGQMIALSNSVEPALDPLGVELLALDNNWSDDALVDELLADGRFDAVAYHCYDGEPSAMAASPIDALVAECTATTGGWHSSVGWMSRVLVGDAIRAGSTGLLMWNLALDADHGPKLPGGCEDCRGLLTIDRTTGAVTRSPEFWVLSHLSRAADPGAVVVATERVDGLPIAVFRNPDDSIGVFGHNDRAEPVVIAIEVDGAEVWSGEIPSWGIFSARG